MFNANLRIYELDKSRPIWRKHWQEVEIIGETSRSWLLGSPWRPLKLSKASFRSGACPAGWARSWADVENLAWVHENRHRIAEHLHRVQDPKVLRDVAKLINYQEKTE